ncbi:MAG: hypothetical protein WDM89_02985 [Rhizomicrobium sp.]
MKQETAKPKNAGTQGRNIIPLMRGAPYASYDLGLAYDEMFARDGSVRPQYRQLDGRLRTLPSGELARRQNACEQSFLHQASHSRFTPMHRPQSGSSRQTFCHA